MEIQSARLRQNVFSVCCDFTILQNLHVGKIIFIMKSPEDKSTDALLIKWKSDDEPFNWRSLDTLLEYRRRSWVIFLLLLERVWSSQIKLMLCYFTHITCSFCFTHNNNSAWAHQSIHTIESKNKSASYINSKLSSHCREVEEEELWLVEGNNSLGPMWTRRALILDETLMVRLEAYPDCRLFRNIYIEKVSVIISPVFSLSVVQYVVSC